MELKNTDYFIEKSRSIHGNKYDYSKSIYNGSHNKIEIICSEHGSFWQSVSDHYAGNGCSMCNGLNNKILTQDEFVSIINELLPELTVVGIYKGTKYKINVLDSDGIEYCISTRLLLNGKMPTITAALDPNHAFKIKAIKKHGNKYTYLNSVYSTVRNKITITCPIHGDFTVCTNSFLLGQGCQECSRIEKSIRLSNRSMDWTLSGWIKSAEESSKFESFKVYFIECFNSEERFIKIGRTYSSLKNRFDQKTSMPYNYNILKIISDNPHRIFKLEHKLHRMFKQYSVEPKIFFHGRSECFSTEIIPLLENIK